jgi:adenylyltransferase/sulfurtransferase
VADLARYSRQLMLPDFGAGGQAALGGARVLVIGAGGLGSTVLPQLAAVGVGTIGIVDDDLVEVSNLHRQTLYLPSDVGTPKAARAAARLRELNPEATVRAHLDRLDSSNALELFAAYDLVIDGSDTFPTRYLVDDAATLSGIPSVWGAVHQYGGQVGVSWEAHGPSYRDLFPVPPEPGTVPSCSEAGVLPSVCVVVGGLLVSEAVKLIIGIGEPLLGRVVAYDARTGGFRELEYARDPERVPVVGLVDYEEFCGVRPAPTQPEAENTGRGDLQVDVPEEITVETLAALREAGEPIQLVDVREPWEAELARIGGAVLIPLRQLPARWSELDPAAPTVIYCHSGYRSAQARDMLRAIDFENATSLAGGIDAWSQAVDPTVPRY